MKLAIIGKQKPLCLAELESVSKNIKYTGGEAAIFDGDVDINILGGTIKIGGIISGVESHNTAKLAAVITEYITSLNKSKINFGISSYDARINSNALSMKVKSALKKNSIKVRHVRSSDNIINAASIKHNKLIGNGIEILIAKVDGKYILAYTIGIQDIDSYSKRDYQKPCRDTKVGMLPPKLAQILINLASPNFKHVVVDPFCGSGTIMMESALMGYKSEGSDLSPEMIKCSNQNLDWLNNEYNSVRDLGEVDVIDETQDATTRKYELEDYCIVSEGYLGQNFTQKPSLKEIDSQQDELLRIYKEFFKNLANQSHRPKSIVLCLPFWGDNKNPIKLNIIDYILSLGYTIKDFEFADSLDLLYHREGQNTGRQILVLELNKREK